MSQTKNGMTVFEFAMYRYAARLMRAEERERAEVLAQQADAGDRAAWQGFQELTVAVLADARAGNRPRSAKRRNGR